MSSREIIRTEHLTKTYPSDGGGRFNAVDDVSLTFHRGEVTAILGPNGAGKTTLLDIVLGLNIADAGRVSVAGKPPKKAVQSGHVGALLQTGGLLPDLSVKETVQMIAALHHDHIGVDSVMETAGLRGIAGRAVGKCSGGQQQRLKSAPAHHAKEAVR